MTSIRRLPAVAAGAAIVLMMTAGGHASAATASPTRSSARREPPSGALAAVPASPAANRVLVRTVSAPGGMSAGMREALSIAGVLSAPSSGDLLVERRADGSTMVTSTSRFLSVVVVKAGAEGEARTRCVSSLDEALRELASQHAPDASAERE